MLGTLVGGSLLARQLKEPRLTRAVINVKERAHYKGNLSQANIQPLARQPLICQPLIHQPRLAAYPTPARYWVATPSAHFYISELATYVRRHIQATDPHARRQAHPLLPPQAALGRIEES
ncbi:hypothetical protein IHE31_12880 [Mycetohabitans rhizoxinica]|uniref:hypothetical protein n=1 Tax=Mycetohabitans sp. B2 TaxID=2841274 RepID=UPI001F45CF25|nr:hypothetical protein [Mycetohabitans sp. B2]MCF7696412.1 hypothetical protein [Mycetohabitans sp. B2]